MSRQAVFEYLRSIVGEYFKCSKSQKSQLLVHAALATGLSRPHLARTLRQIRKNPSYKPRSGRPKRFPEALLLPHIRILWISMERISARRMKAALPEWLSYYEHPNFNPKVKKLLLAMSYSTLDRFLKTIRASQSIKKGLSTTCPARYMKNKIPINTFDSKVDRPGYLQADTVAHCGNTTAGQYIHTLTLTDIYSGWTENRSFYRKIARNVRSKLVDMERSMAFDFLSINFDSGSEFLNSEILNWGRQGQGRKNIRLTRSRPYRKNDNCYVEQKNFTHVRELFGYERIEDESLIPLMNDILSNYWNPLQNFFIPCFKLESKTRVGSKIVKKYGPPLTPYQRLLNSNLIPDEKKNMLRKQKAKLNPFQLKKELEDKLKTFFDLLRKSKTKRISA